MTDSSREDGDREQGFSVATVTLVFVILVCTVISVLQASRLVEQRQEALETGKRDTANLVTSLTQHAELTFRATDAALAGLVARLEDPTLQGEDRASLLKRWFRNQIERLPQVGVFTVSDQNGQTLFHSEQEQATTNTSDRDYFRYHLARNDREVYIGPPIFGRVVKRWLIPVSRRYNGPDGSFAGVATAFLDLSFFQSFYEQFDIGANGAILLMSGDYKLLVRRPFLEANVGRDMTNSNVAKALQQSPVDTVEFKATTDGVNRLNSYRRSEHYPLVVVVARSTDEILAPWRSRAAREITETTILLTIIAVAGFVLWKMTRQLSLATRRLDAAINAIPLGFCLFDAERRLVIANDRFGELYQYPPHLLRPGTLLRDIIGHIAERGAKQGDMTVEQYVNGIMAQSAETLFNLDGKLIAITRHPAPGGGWVATHEDITEQKRGERLLAAKAAEIQLINDRFRAAIDNLPQGLCVFDSEQRVVIFNEQLRDIYGYSDDVLKTGATVQSLVADLEQRGIAWDAAPEELIRLPAGHKRHSEVEVHGRVVSIQRLKTSDGGWVATHEDITEQRRAEQLLATQAAELKRANERFESAINNMPQGVCLFDAEQRVVVANSRYGELYHLDADQIKPGTTLQEILDYRRQHGTGLITAPDVYRTVNIKKSQDVQDLADGRTMSISRRILSDGGWLTTHEDITDRRKDEQRIAYLASHDPLTGLSNRASFINALEHATTGDGTASAAVFLLDLDRFKGVNDRLGHAAGDQLLKDVAKRLRATVREQDVVARLGGDEFAIIQRLETAGHEPVISLALRVIDAVARPFEIDGHTADVGTSIGIVLCPEQGRDGTDLLKKADLALYAVKAEGRNDFRIYDSTMSKVVEDQKMLEEELRLAVERGEFELHYQPILDAKSRTIGGAEALVRWKHPTRGMLAPDQFIPLAEETGLIIPLGDWILQQGCKDAAAWPSHMRIAINLSAHQFKKGNLFDVVLCALVESGLNPERLELEVTETALLGNQPEYLQTLRQLKNIGISIVLDDFGTGYSSARYLTLYPFDKIKLDKSFVQGMATRRECSAVVDSTLALARGLGIAVTAEGIETQDQLQRLCAGGVDFAQGFLIGRPVTLGELAAVNWTSTAAIVAQAS